jgi:hypothetical protein
VALAVGVDGARDQLLAGAGLAAHEDRVVEVVQRFELAQHQQHGRVFAEQRGAARRGVAVARQRGEAARRAGAGGDELAHVLDLPGERHQPSGAVEDRVQVDPHRQVVAVGAAQDRLERLRHAVLQDRVQRALEVAPLGRRKERGERRARQRAAEGTGQRPVIGEPQAALQVEEKQHVGGALQQRPLLVAGR